MYYRSLLSAALAATSLVVFSTAATEAAVMVPRPAINIVVPRPAISLPRPTVQVAVPRMALPGRAVISPTRAPIAASLPARMPGVKTAALQANSTLKETPTGANTTGNTTPGTGTTTGKDTAGGKKPDTGGKDPGKDPGKGDGKDAKEKPPAEQPKTAGNDDDDYITGDEDYVKPPPPAPKLPVKPQVPGKTGEKKPQPPYTPKPGLVAASTDSDGDTATVVVNPNGSVTVTKVIDGQKETKTRPPTNPPPKEVKPVAPKKEVKPEPEKAKEAKAEPKKPGKPTPKDDDDLLEGD